jgi:hypothetical protein
VSSFLPFTAEEFFAVFAAYNAAIWPAQVGAYGLGLAAIVLVLWRPVGRAVFAVLALMWAWTGIGYHVLFFAGINPAAYAFGALFVAEAAALMWAAAMPRDLFLRAPRVDIWLGLGLCGYSLFLYPLIGLWFGHVYPAAPAFGVTPCPVTIFTFGMLLLKGGRAPWVVVAVPVAWSLVGGSAAVFLNVVQDWALPVSAAVYLMRRWPRSAIFFAG